MKSHFALPLIFILGFGFYFAYAHKTITVEQYDIEVGWKEEPPLVGIQNAITFEFSQDEGNGVTTPVTNSFRDLEATVKSGSLTKTLEVLSDAKPGNYYTKIIPTKTGSLIIELKGTLNGVPVNQEIQIEDVESTDVLAFPLSGSSSGQDVSALKNAMSSLQRDVTEIKSKIGNVAGGDDIDLSKAYDFGVFGLALGTAGVILAVFAMVKRK
ncbi:MAG: hypothetical protein HZA84_02800 [Thaumarchaeota archaeon]|nr:hypothetical protein [Nitrososphaerota archaeon]